MIKVCQTHGCKTCGRWHHTSIHRDKYLPREHNNKGQKLSQQQENVQGTYHTFKESSVICVLLAKAQIKVKYWKGNFQTSRVLLDCYSQSNFITDSIFRSL